MKFILLVSIFLNLSITLYGECPNGCSGHGTCGTKDMCHCYKNYQGNDCSERTCPFGYAHVDTPKGDLNMDGSRTTSEIIENSQVYPYKTTEEMNNNDDEAHYYMECSNQGICDREAGDCVCFDGYEGSACQRASCPNQCSGHGSCESISEFGSYGSDGSLFLKGVPQGSQSYNLWDKKVTYGCKCDPWYTGADCSQRSCKVGIDPMFFDTEQYVYDTIVITFNGFDASGEYIRLTFWDYFGESYLTDFIFYDTSDAVTAEAIENALLNIPNDMISDVNCYSDISGTSDVTIIIGDAVCEFKSNPGSLRIPKLDFYGPNTDTSPIIKSSPRRGEDSTLTPYKMPHTTDATTTVSDDGTDSSIKYSEDDVSLSLAVNSYLFKYEGIYFVGTVSSSSNLIKVEGGPASLISDGTRSGGPNSADLFYGEVITLSNGVSYEFTSTANQFKYSSGASATFTPGDTIILANQIYIVHNDQITTTTERTVTVDRAIYGVFLTGGSNTETTNIVYILSKSNQHKYVSECSSRGLCDRETGICECFTGYTRDNCNTQNVMAF